MALCHTSRLRPAASYGLATIRLQGLMVITAIFLAGTPTAFAASAPVRIVCLGDSLTAGYQLPAEAAFPVVLAKALRADGLVAEIANAGISGDTSGGGLERLDWSVADGTDIVVLELGANDMLRGIDPAIPRRALDTIISRLKARKIRVLLTGVPSAANFGADYKSRFEAIFPDLAAKYGLALYPSFLAGVTNVPGMTQPDGLHPTRAGVETIVRGILPLVKAEIAKVGS